MRSHTLSAKALDALYRRAAQQQKEAIYVVVFNDPKLVATITITRSM